MTPKFNPPFQRGVFLLPLCIFLLSCAATSAWGQEGYLFRFYPPSVLKIVEKQNLRKSENGRYRGFIYREERSVLRETGMEGGFRTYEGELYRLEEMKREARFVAVPVDAYYSASMRLNELGFMERTQINFPRLLNFPLFPEEPVAPGDTWRAFGERLVDPLNSGHLTRVQFYCEYEYVGEGEYYGKWGHSIRAQYAVRYRRGDDRNGDFALASVQGRHIVSIILYEDGGIFMRDTVDEQYQHDDVGEITFSGFILTWYNHVVGLDRTELLRDLQEDLEEKGVPGIDLQEDDRGVALTIRDLNFIADSPELLPSERGRLDEIAEILSRVENRTILVIGHTADVGTQESQFELSIQRAKAIIDAMTERGLPAERFMYLGKGGTEPIASNDTDKGRAQNRRVEIIILED